MNTVKESSSHLSEQDWDGVHSVTADERKPSMSSYNIIVNTKVNFIVLIWEAIFRFFLATPCFDTEKSVYILDE
jgi:hypothetical protein